MKKLFFLIKACIFLTTILSCKSEEDNEMEDISEYAKKSESGKKYTPQPQGKTVHIIGIKDKLTNIYDTYKNSQNTRSHRVKKAKKNLNKFFKFFDKRQNRIANLDTIQKKFSKNMKVTINDIEKNINIFINANEISQIKDLLYSYNKIIFSFKNEIIVNNYSQTLPLYKLKKRKDGDKITYQIKKKKFKKH